MKISTVFLKAAKYLDKKGRSDGNFNFVHEFFACNAIQIVQKKSYFDRSDARKYFEDLFEVELLESQFNTDPCLEFQGNGIFGPPEIESNQRDRVTALLLAYEAAKAEGL